MKGSIPNKKTIKILVIDDDPVFRSLMSKAASKKQVKLTVAGSLEEVDPNEVPREFDIVVLDYYLDDMQENLTGTDIAKVMEATPILLTSYTDHAVSENESWPVSVRRFINKKMGADAILNQAVQLARG